MLQTFILALVSSVANFVIAFVLSSYALRNHGIMQTYSSYLCGAQALVAATHAWLLWSASAFIDSPPNILKLVCGYKPNNASREQESSNEDDGVTNLQQPDNEVFDSDAPHNAESALGVDPLAADISPDQPAPKVKAFTRHRARKFVLSIIIAVSNFMSIEFHDSLSHPMSFTHVCFCYFVLCL